MKTVKKMLQKGFSTMQVVAGLAIAAVVTAGAAAVMLPAYNTMILNSAFEEIGVLSSGIRSLREYEGSYENISTTDLKYLTDNGYLTSPPYTDGEGENRLGNTITLAASATPFLVATVTYEFDTRIQCLNIEQRVDGIVGLNTLSNPCGTGTTDKTLTFTLN